MFKRSEQVYTIHEFLHRNDPVVKATGGISHLTKASITPLAVAPALMVKQAFAAGSITNPDVPVSIDASNIFEKIMVAFEPLVTLAQALAYPIALVVAIGGALYVLVGSREKGFSMIQGAGLGYVLVQITPLIFKILVGAMGGGA